MGKIIVPPYRIEYRTNLMALGRDGADGASTVDRKQVKNMIWETRRSVYSPSTPDGAPNEQNLEAWRQKWNQRFRDMATNRPDDFPLVSHINWCRIVRQKTNEVVCEVRAPAFEAA